ncbi:MAG: Rieske 2Fe-2S domain-containing protein [Dehalococcoidia bacterium]|nr:Rieske 2Fe-2S domain-containing protein [Dehalococcoidia bacterium]
MLTKEQNDTLTRVGPATPMGDLMRRYWVPAALSWEVPEPDSPPITIKLLGEELVAFRQTDGRVGVVGARCAHRRAHLFWGRNEENGIRCVYHGWKFDCEGACVDMPSEPEESNFKDKVRIPAYPTVEAGGVVWAYMGPLEKKPEPPHFEWTQVTPGRRSMSKVWEQCNWLQALEGGIDTVHSNFLHLGRPPGVKYQGDDPRIRALNTSTAPVLEVVPTDYGYSYAGIRSMGDEGTNHVRAYHWVMPWNQIRAGSGKEVSGHMWVPMDDENTMVFNWSYSYGEIPDGRGDTPSPSIFAAAGGDSPTDGIDVDPLWFRDASRPSGGGNAFGADISVEDSFRSTRNLDNKYKIDRNMQCTANYTGIIGTNVQDRAIQESMGAIADRTLERLGTTDRAIINARRTLLKAVQTVQDGGNPPGVAPTYYKLRAIDRVLPAGVPWFEALKADMYQLPETKQPATA